MDKIYNSIIESLIFSSDEPINSSEILKAIKEIDGEEAPIKIEDVDVCVNELNEKYAEGGIGFNILKIANGYIYATRPDSAKYVGFLSTEKSKRRLSQAALETLAIIAYKQPITKPEIESIRGVNSDYIMNMLLEKELITITGRAETLGRPLLYGTTNEFLKYFGLFNLSDLPKPREIEEIMQDEYFIEQKRKIMMNALEDEMAREEAEKEDGGGKDDSEDNEMMEIEFTDNELVNEENLLKNDHNSGDEPNSDAVKTTMLIEDNTALIAEDEVDEEIEIDDDENDSFELEATEENLTEIDNPENSFSEEEYNTGAEPENENGESELDEIK